jgi:predicted flavoprotein YhiN
VFRRVIERLRVFEPLVSSGEKSVNFSQLEDSLNEFAAKNPEAKEICSSLLKKLGFIPRMQDQG